MILVESAKPIYGTRVPIGIDGAHINLVDRWKDYKYIEGQDFNPNWV